MKLKHAGSFFDTVYCKQDGCIRIFSDIYSFKKHLNTKHCNITKPLVINSVETFENMEVDMTYDSNMINNSTSQKLDECSLSIAVQPSISSVEQFQNILTTRTSQFIGKLYCNANISKVAIQDIIINTKELFNSDFQDILKEAHINSINNSNNNFNDIIEALSNPFENVDTEYKREQFLEKSGFLIRPREFVIGTEEYPISVNNITTLKMKNCTGQFIPLRNVFKKFLEIPNVLSTIKNYIVDCSKQINITSFLNADLWSKIKTKFPGKFVIPLMFFFDDVELNNPLGSHKGINKIGAVYCRMLAIPPQYSSRIENIFLIELHKSYHQNNFGMNEVLRPIIKELQFLEDIGISIETEQGVEQVHFTLALFAGDNLGIHTLFGFQESFRSNYYCHLCRADKEFLQKATVEDK